jgi:putative ribosome biogenesis GTPase RsgA
VGRTREIAALRSIVDARGSAVLVGESGIGKTSLIASATAGHGAAMGGALGMLRFIP